MNYIKANFLSLIILLLAAVIIVQRCGKPPVIEKPTIVRDTVWIKHDSIIYVKPQIINTIPAPPETINHYQADTNYYRLRDQYMYLLKLYLAKNIQNDTLRIDSIGWVNVRDTVTKNLIDNRAYSYSLIHPIITTTITPPSEKRNQLYIGGGLQGTFDNVVNQINAGLLLKNRKDQIFGGYAGMNKDGQLILGIQSYWKISFRK